jgi:hypothetical protein
MDEHPKSSVSIEQLGDQWAVQILEAGAVTKRLFEREEFARNYAASQWLRLNPKPVLRKSRRKPKL